MSVSLIKRAREMARALDDERGGADRFEAARLLRALAKEVRSHGYVLCGNCGRSYNRYDAGADKKHGHEVCAPSSTPPESRDND